MAGRQQHAKSDHKRAAGPVEPARNQLRVGESKMTRRNKLLACEEFARQLVSPVLVLGQSKSSLGPLTQHVIRSVGTARDFQQCVREFLAWRVAGGVRIDAPVTRCELEEYLSQESSRWRQKTVDQHK
jgi:hypothetical protein